MLDLNVQILANIFFGLGILIHYCALLRILSYFKQFNVSIKFFMHILFSYIIKVTLDCKTQIY